MKGNSFSLLLLLLCLAYSEVVPLDKNIVTEIFQGSILFPMQISLTSFMCMETLTTSTSSQPSTGIATEMTVFAPS